MRLGKVAIVDRRNFAPFDFLNIAAGADPIGAQRGKSLIHVDLLIGIAPRSAGVVNADRFVHFNLAGHGFGRREGDFAERNADVGVELAGEVDLAGVGQEPHRMVVSLGDLLDGFHGLDIVRSVICESVLIRG